VNFFLIVSTFIIMAHFTSKREPCINYLIIHESRWKNTDMKIVIAVQMMYSANKH
jgi:hypothetical protein